MCRDNFSSWMLLPVSQEILLPKNCIGEFAPFPFTLFPLRTFPIGDFKKYLVIKRCVYFGRVHNENYGTVSKSLF